MSKEILKAYKFHDDAAAAVAIHGSIDSSISSAIATHDAAAVISRNAAITAHDDAAIIARNAAIAAAIALNPGPTGPTGPDGPAGSDGADGINGTNGTQGIPGSDGVDGDQGIQGLQGLTGDQGIQGDKGIEGIQGTAGTNGTNGSAGADGSDALATKIYADVVLEYRVSVNTEGGTLTNGSYRDMPLNTESLDVDGLCTLSSNRFTLLRTGWWNILAWPTLYKTSGNQIRLRRLTPTASTMLWGSTGRTSGGVGSMIAPVISGRFWVTSGDAFEVQIRAYSSKTTHGFGYPANVGTATERYGHVELWSPPL